MSPVHAAMLAALRQAHMLYLDSIGRNIASVERMAEMVGVEDDQRIVEELKALRELRANSERSCREMQASFAEVLA